MDSASRQFVQVKAGQEIASASGFGRSENRYVIYFEVSGAKLAFDIGVVRRLSKGGKPRAISTPLPVAVYAENRGDNSSVPGRPRPNYLRSERQYHGDHYRDDR